MAEKFVQGQLTTSVHAAVTVDTSARITAALSYPHDQRYKEKEKDVIPAT